MIIELEAIPIDNTDYDLKDLVEIDDVRHHKVYILEQSKEEIKLYIVPEEREFSPALFSIDVNYSHLKVRASYRAATRPPRLDIRALPALFAAHSVLH